MAKVSILSADTILNWNIINETEAVEQGQNGLRQVCIWLFLCL